MPQWVVVVMPLRLVIRAIVATPWLRVFTPPRLLALIPSPWLLLPRRLRSPPGLLIHRSAFAASFPLGPTYFCDLSQVMYRLKHAAPSPVRPIGHSHTQPPPATPHPAVAPARHLGVFPAGCECRGFTELSCAKANRIFF
jgi:hypothetical protein